MSDERQRNFKVAKQEAQQQERSQTEELNMKHIMDVLANKQLADILKAIEKLAKQNENLQKKYAEGVQMNLQHYLDVRVVDATAAILKQHSEKLEIIQRNNNYNIKKINEKINLLLGVLATIFVSMAGFVVYRYFVR